MMTTISLIAIFITAAIVGVVIFWRRARYARNTKTAEHLTKDQDSAKRQEIGNDQIETSTLLTASTLQNTSEKRESTEKNVVQDKDVENSKEGKDNPIDGSRSPKKYLTPIERGGRSRDKSPISSKRTPNTTKTRELKPEIVCWKQERRWFVGVEVPEGIFERTGPLMQKNGAVLPKDETIENTWHLSCFDNEISGNGTTNLNLRIPEFPILFKLSGQNGDCGRCVKRPSRSAYLAVAPEAWKRDEALSGPPNLSSESVFLSGYRAHYFDLGDKYDKIAFLNHQPIASTQAQFEMTGDVIPDAHDGMGPLFVGKPPRIRGVNNDVWKSVGTIIIGNEGAGRGKWRKAFNPLIESIEQDLPVEIETRKDGWYFLRFYDNNDDLAESFDFRLVNGLRGIIISQTSPMPSKDGHENVSIRFEHDPSYHIQLIDKYRDEIKIEQEGESTVLTIPPKASKDRTRCAIGSDGMAKVEVEILVERLWWAMGHGNKAPSESDWKAVAVHLSRSDFEATSNHAIWVRLPKIRWVDEIRVGFDRQRSRRFRVEVSKYQIPIPLREFTDSQELAHIAEERTLKMWLEQNNSPLETILAIIPAEKAVVKREALSVPIVEIKKVSFSSISLPRLAGVLSQLRKIVPGPSRVLLKEIRKGYSKERKQSTGSKTFLIEGLCTIALATELVEKVQVRHFGVNTRWATRGRYAAKEFPEVIDELRNRHAKLKNKLGAS